MLGYSILGWFTWSSQVEMSRKARIINVFFRTLPVLYIQTLTNSEIPFKYLWSLILSTRKKTDFFSFSLRNWCIWNVSSLVTDQPWKWFFFFGVYVLYFSFNITRGETMVSPIKELDDNNEMYYFLC